MRVLGLGILAACLIALALAIRSFIGLRGWTERSRALSTAAIARQVAPHLLIPAVVLVAVYRFAGPLLFGTAWAFNLSYVGLYMIPDIALLLALSTVPDLGQGLYMSVAVVADRVQQRRRRRDAVGVGAGPRGHHHLPAPRRTLP